VDSLGKSLCHEAVNDLLVAVRDKDADVKFIAAKGLGKINAREAIPFIVSVFDHLTEDKCPIIADTLISFGRDAYKEIISKLDPQQELTCYWLLRILAVGERISDASLQTLIKQKLAPIFDSHNEKLRGYALTAAANAGAHFGDDFIGRFFQDKSPFVRAKLAESFGISMDKKDIRYLFYMLGDDCWDVNYAAAQALLLYGKSVKDWLNNGLKAKEHIIRKRSQEILRELELQ